MRSRPTYLFFILLTLLVAFPFRIYNLFGDVLHTLRSNNHRITLSALKPSSIRGLLDRDTGRPYSIRARMFPHLRTHPGFVPAPVTPPGVYSSSRLLSSTSPSYMIVSACRSLCHTFSLSARHILHYLTLPLQLTSQEIRVKRLELERIRDERAEALGELTNKHDDISRALRNDLDERAAFLQVINRVLVGQHANTMELGSSPSLLDALVTTSSKILPMHTSLHKEDLHRYSLLRPNRFVRIWPQLLILPPLALYAIQRIGASHLHSLAKDAWETLKGFWRGWLVEPLADIAKTVRASGESNIVLSKESIDANLQVFICHSQNSYLDLAL